MSRNITIDPTAQTPAVLDPEVPEVRSTKSGRLLLARRFISKFRYDRFVRARAEVRSSVRRDTPRFVCPLCGKGLYLSGDLSKAGHFRHRAGDGEACQERVRGLPEGVIRAMKYRGAQESEAHLRAKALIVASLEADARFSDVLVEKTWRGEVDPKSLRRPDVSARFEGLRIAFEAQLSTTFLDVVLDRREFYSQEGGLLVWVMPFFDPENRRMTADDIFFPNNSNVLLVDSETVALSQALGRLTFRCWIAHRVIGDDGRISTKWESRLVAWDDLTLDLRGQRIFAVDVDREEKAARERHSAAEVDREAADKDAVRRGWLDYFSYADGDIDFTTHEKLRESLRSEGLRLQIPMSGARYITLEVRSAVRAVLSAHTGKPIGFKFVTLVQVAHHLHDKAKGALLPFGCAIRAFGRTGLIAEADKSGKWGGRAVLVREGMAIGESCYLLEEEEHAFLCFLFPGLAGFMDRARGVVFAAGAHRIAEIKAGRVF
ncbi:DUF6035 family protein [Rhodoblastus sp.]|jgi:hypothetical protein|uniref:DUF6035 family protein n=1 Tax=Rhodoblastus sp. TaxID=1962975 RepID=UPI0025D739E4|nr:DUF6035 family protein [Rhodoblastus sp.]